MAASTDVPAPETAASLSFAHRIRSTRGSGIAGFHHAKQILSAFIAPRNSEGKYPLQFLDLASGKITTIAAIDKPVYLGLSVAAGPEGRRWILYTQVDHEGSDLMLVENFR